MATKTASKTTVAAQEFLDDATKHGFRVEADRRYSGDAVITIEKYFAPGDRDAYVAADGVAGSILLGAPTVTYGTTWGTDGASVGGHAGMTQGYYRLSKSGVSKRFANALAKLLEGGR